MPLWWAKRFSRKFALEKRVGRGEFPARIYDFLNTVLKEVRIDRYQYEP
jgi:hypothetical protein